MIPPQDWRQKMKLSRGASLQAVTAAIAIGLSALTVPGLAGVNRTGAAQWSVVVNQVDPGALSIGPEFKVAIYENLLHELVKNKQFSAVLRSGDRSANDAPTLLILKTTVESYTPGSEKKRAV